MRPATSSARRWWSSPRMSWRGRGSSTPGQRAAARRHFEQALARAPRRSLSLLGLARAAARMGDAAAAAEAYADLARSWRQADADLPERAEVAAAASTARIAR